MSILITTYEGNHNHPLTPSAQAMASTTSAAASVLLSGSSTSFHSRTTTSPLSMSTDTTSLNRGMNFYVSNSSKSDQLYISPPSLSSHPTITLDLTSNPPSSSSSPFRRFATSSKSNYVNFSSSESNSMSWNNNGFLSSHSQTYNNSNNILSTVKLGTQAMENNIYYSYMQRNNNSNIFQIPSSQYSLQDQTIAAATKAITTDPNFQSALAAALTSVIGTENKGVGEI